eukprot:3377293-Rhodomonas_salina.3
MPHCYQTNSFRSVREIKGKSTPAPHTLYRKSALSSLILPRAICTHTDPRLVLTRVYRGTRDIYQEVASAYAPTPVLRRAPRA